MPLEYVFDWWDPKTEKEKKLEIDAAIEQAEEAASEVGFAGEFKNLSFRNREEFPGLQCSDLLAWAAFQQVLMLECKKPLSKYAEIAWRDFDTHCDPNWREVLTIRKSELERWVNSPEAVAHTQEWFGKWAAKKAAEQVASKKSAGI